MPWHTLRIGTGLVLSSKFVSTAWHGRLFLAGSKLFFFGAFATAFTANDDTAHLRRGGVCSQGYCDPNRQMQGAGRTTGRERSSATPPRNDGRIHMVSGAQG